MYLKITLLLLLLNGSLFFNGCDKRDRRTSSEPPLSSQEFTPQEKNFVHNLFLTEYLWYDQVDTSIDHLNFTSPQALVNVLRVYPPDRWSFSISQQQYENYINQKTGGYGFGYHIDTFTIYMVRIDSPSWNKLQRGDKIIAIDDQAVTQSLIKETSQDWGHAHTFTIDRKGEIIHIALTPDIYTFKVTDASVIPYNGKYIGYMRYDSFSNGSVSEIETAFTHFKTAQIDELIIDLRYNGGGSTAVASILLDNITNRYPGEKQFYLDWNENYKHHNESYHFEASDEEDGNELSMNRVIFLVTRNTASASELTISSLKPYLGDSNVITIGTATHGKNVGMAGRVFGENYYFLINFYIRNSADETTDFNGIPATCTAEDDLDNLRGDPNEAMLHAALNYIATGHCP